MTIPDLQSPQPRKSTLPQPSRPRRNILVIEDDKDTAALICLQLVQEGYGARQVATRDDALKVLDMYIYDFILMDYWMPGMDAKEFIAKVFKRRPNSRIVLMTAAGSIGEISKALGIYCCLPKPITPESLVPALKQFEDQ
jgi:DNA-binding NtrC family response regulator